MEGTHDFEGVGDDADGHELFTVVATVHHQRIGETLNDGTLCFSKALDRVATGGVGDVDGGSDLDVVTGRRKIALADMYCWHKSNIWRFSRQYPPVRVSNDSLLPSFR